MEKWQELFLWRGLPHTSLLCLLMLLLGLNFLEQPLQANTWPLCCQTLCRLGICKDLKDFHRHFKGEPSLSLMLCPPTLIPSSNNMISFTNLPSTCRSRCQKMSTPLHVLLKSDLRLEGDVAGDKADPSVCVKLHQISLLQYFCRTQGGPA